MISTSKTFGKALTALVAGALLSLPSTQASALSNSVKMACMADYFSYCSSHSVGSPGLRQCMSAAGPKLSKRCINALVAAGEVSQAEVSRRAASLR